MQIVSEAEKKLATLQKEKEKVHFLTSNGTKIILVSAVARVWVAEDTEGGYKDNETDKADQGVWDEAKPNTKLVS